jgi:hypothetical protein
MDLLSRDGKGSTTAFSGVQDIGLHILKRNGRAAAAPGSFVARDFRAPKIFRPTAIPLKICKPARIFSESLFYGTTFPGRIYFISGPHQNGSQFRAAAFFTTVITVK